MIKATTLSLLFGYSIGVAIVAVLVCTIPAAVWRSQPYQRGDGGLFDVDFASRLTGTCTGWTPALTWFHTFGDLATWFAYCAISISVFRDHPIVAKIKKSRLTMLAIAAVFFTCGMVHLLNAYTNIYPMYRFAGWFKAVAGVIGIAGSVLVTNSLLNAKRLWTDQKVELESLERRRAGMG